MVEFLFNVAVHDKIFELCNSGYSFAIDVHHGVPLKTALSRMYTVSREESSNFCSDVHNSTASAAVALVFMLVVCADTDDDVVDVCRASTLVEERKSTAKFHNVVPSIDSVDSHATGSLQPSRLWFCRRFLSGPDSYKLSG